MQIYEWIKLHIKQLMFTVLSVLFSFLTLMAVVQAISWRLSEAKLESFASEVLDRSVNLVTQADEIAALKGEGRDTPQCSDNDIYHLRTLLWRYQLIKDIGRISQQSVICTALWGRLKPAQPLPQQASPAGNIVGGWLFHLPVASGIDATALRRNDTLVVVSPFIYTRLENDPHAAGYSAIVANYRHTQHYFAFGKDTEALEQLHDRNRSKWNYIFYKRCAPQYDLCVLAGAPPQPFFAWSLPVNIFLLAISLITGLLISLSWTLYRRKQSALPARLQRALAEQKLTLVYQPIFEVASGKPGGLEVLLRWQDNDLGFISPDVFIPLAEKHGLIPQLTEYVTARALEESRELLLQYPLTLSINVCLSDLLSQRYLLFLQGVTRDAGLQPQQIMLEITERHGGNIQHIAAAVTRFKQQGFLIALDDFGTGYSNIAWLSQLPIDEIKIDKSITDSIGTRSLNKTLLINLILLLKSMPQLVVFEGLEQQQQIDYLAQAFPRCYGQGWWYAKPLEINTLRDLLAQHL